MPDPTDHNVAEELDRAAARLAAAGCPKPDVDARAIIADSLGLSWSAALDPHDRVSSLVRHHIAERIDRRARREPLEYVLGTCMFRGLSLSVDPRVLVPEEDTGPLVDIALTLPKGSRVHDVGTGSGAHALAIKHERPDLVVSASDISADAVEVARANGRRLNLDVPVAVARGLPPGTYDLVVANLPYNDSELRVVPDPPEVTSYQPSIAIFGGGSDGLDVIREFLRAAGPASRIVIQHDVSQTEAVRALFTDGKPFGPTSGSKRFTVGHPAAL